MRCVPLAGMIDWYAHCSRVLETANADLGFAESHGLLCGRICSERDVDIEDWICEVIGSEAKGDRERCEAVLRAVSDETRAQLEAPDFGFAPFLPDDEEPLALRCSELARWCQGFLYGLGATGRLDVETLGDDTREMLSDLSAITALGAGGESEDVERDYCELVEYLRTGVMLINEELTHRSHPGGAGGPASEFPTTERVH